MKSKAPTPAKHAPIAPEHDTAAAAFLKEVDEALQYERLMNIWHTYKYAILAAVLGLLLAVAGLQGWDAYKAHQSRGLAERWYALGQAEADVAHKTMHLSAFEKSAAEGYKALAVFNRAEIAPTPQLKAKAYTSVAGDATQPEWLRNLARFNAAISLLSVDDAAAQSQFELLTQEGKQQTATYAPALEQLAILAVRCADATSARGFTEKLLALPSETLPPDLRQRARQRLGLLSTIAR